MKKYLFGLSIVTLLTSCGGSGGGNPLQTITGEIEQTFTIDWRSLPANEVIPITSPEGYQQVTFVSIQDFDVQDIEQFLDPTISAMYYDINGWEDVNSAGLFEVTISVVSNFGIPRRLTTFSISNLENTTTLNNTDIVLSKQLIYNDNQGSVAVDGLVFANQSLLQGRITIEVEVAGRNVLLQSPDRFDIILSMELAALATVND